MGIGPSSLRWWAAFKRSWMLYHLGDPRFRFMWDAPPPNEWVALDCETTGLNTRTDDISAIGAVRIRGNRVMTSERLELLVRPELTSGKVVNLAPGTSLSVNLYWHCWNLQSDVLDGLSQALRTSAAAALRQAA